jgi:hypothetical protein
MQRLLAMAPTTDRGTFHLFVKIARDTAPPSTRPARRAAACGPANGRRSGEGGGGGEGGCGAVSDAFRSAQPLRAKGSFDFPSK